METSCPEVTTKAIRNFWRAYNLVKGYEKDIKRILINSNIGPSISKPLDANTIPFKNAGREERDSLLERDGSGVISVFSNK